ncbi:f-box/lrr-repeat protein 2-like [Gigaspora margarita]|uniref:F-box/lrr-repeat protein 2-like n=1 Tax=Gigaspora margarita TaxID=4874 RepID=A0A8H4AG64_GIGMA|nr:f-box/lrr-repeat protein 2-like [Gigaspora margarita]
MASEIFMGDMPELMETIFKNLKEEPNSLFSCILVNRQWKIFYSLGKNDQFFTGLEELSVEAVSDFGGMDEAIMLLRILAKYTTKIITIKFKALDYHFEPQIYHAIAKIVKSQKQLKRFNLNCEAKSQTGIQGIISALEKQSKFLQKIRIKNCVYYTEFEVLMNCENLKVLRVLYCEQQKVLKVLETGDCRLNTLEISSCPIEGSSIIRILERSGTTLQRLKLDSIDQEIFSQQLLLETLIKFCPNIIYLYISYIKLCDQLFNLMSNSKNLQFLTLLWTDDRPEEEVKTQIIQLAKALPLNIQYLDLGNFWINSYIDVFLDHCNISLKKLLFSINFDQNYEKTTEALFKFWSRKRSLEEVNASLYESASVCENGSMLVGRYKSTNVSISSWGKLKKDLEEYVKLVPYESIVVNC